MAAAYGTEAGVSACKRVLRLAEGGLILEDTIELLAEQPVTWVFLLRNQPRLEAGQLLAGSIRMAVDSDLTAQVEKIVISDRRMAKNYPGSLWRLQLTASAALRHARLFRVERIN